MTNPQNEYRGACLCGAVQIKVSGKPVANGYCHCETCRRWHAAPINHWTAWPDDAVSVEAGEALLNSYRLSEHSLRHWCTQCGAGVLNKSNKGLTMVYAVVLENSGLEFSPDMHVNYAARAMDVADDLPKFKDFPQAFGGSGEMAD